MTPGTEYTDDATDEEVDVAISEALRDVEESIARFRAGGYKADAVVFGLMFRPDHDADLIGAGDTERLVELLDAANNDEIEGEALPPLPPE